MESIFIQAKQDSQHVIHLTQTFKFTSDGLTARYPVNAFYSNQLSSTSDTHTCFPQYIQHMHKHAHNDYYTPCGKGFCVFSLPRLTAHNSREHVIHIVREFIALSIMCIATGEKGMIMDKLCCACM